jgi:hypothetical protein
LRLIKGVRINKEVRLNKKMRVNKGVADYVGKMMSGL